MSRQPEPPACMIGVVCSIAEREPDGEHFTSHYIFARHVLGEPRRDAMQIAASARSVRLTRHDCEFVSERWPLTVVEPRDTEQA